MLSRYVEVHRPGKEPAPQQHPELLQWQCWILTLLCQRTTPEPYILVPLAIRPRWVGPMHMQPCFFFFSFFILIVNYTIFKYTPYSTVQIPLSTTHTHYKLPGPVFTIVSAFTSDSPSRSALANWKMSGKDFQLPPCEIFFLCSSVSVLWQGWSFLSSLVHSSQGLAVSIPQVRTKSQQGQGNGKVEVEGDALYLLSGFLNTFRIQVF